MEAQALQAFRDIAPYLTNPLALIGFMLLLLFGGFRTLIKAKIIPTLSQRAGSNIVQLLLRYGFIIALVIIASGFGLEFYRTHRTTAPAIEQSKLIDKAFEALKGQLSVVAGRELEYQETIKALRAALAAIPEQTELPNAKQRIKQALVLAARG